MNRTKIEWCDWTWNPVTGCTPVSAGCEHCYAPGMVKRFPRIHGETGPGCAFDPVEEDPVPFSVLRFHPERMEEPLKLRKPARIFVGSMTDMFHEQVRPEWMDYVLAVMQACPRHTFIMLTKRPENIAAKLYGPTGEDGGRVLGAGDLLANFWLGVTAENQAAADARIPRLLECRACLRHFVSVEPMLGPVDLARWLTPARLLDWVIAGPETGHGARACRDEWIDRLSEPSGCFFDKRKNGWVRRREWPQGPGIYRPFLERLTLHQLDDFRREMAALRRRFQMRTGLGEHHED